jgi:hypothetical protein
MKAVAVNLKKCLLCVVVGAGSEARWLDDRCVLLPLNRGLVTVDIHTLEIINNLPGVFAKCNDLPPRY